MRRSGTPEPGTRITERGARNGLIDLRADGARGSLTFELTSPMARRLATHLLEAAIRVEIQAARSRIAAGVRSARRDSCPQAPGLSGVTGRPAS